MSERPDHVCESGCSIDWLFEPGAPNDPTFRERVQAALAEEEASLSSVPVQVARHADRPRRKRLKDGRLSGVLTRRLLNTAVKHPGELISMETLARGVWTDERPKTWRVALPHLVQQLNRRLGGMEVLTRVGNGVRIAGFRLNARALPKENVTRTQPKPATRWPWSPREDAVLREHAGRKPLSELTALVNAVHGRSRKPTAVEGRMYALGLSKRIRAFSANRLAPILGVSGEKITRWIERGLLRGRRSEPDGLKADSKRWGWWLIEQQDVEAFISAYPWELDWRSMQPGHPLTVLAQTIQRRDPYLTVAEAARRVGCTEIALWQRLDAGQVPGYVRVTPHSPTGNPERATIRIPLSAIADMPARLPRGPRPSPRNGVAV